MIIKLISNTNVDDFNRELKEFVDEMEENGNVLVDSKYKPVKNTINEKIMYTALLFFTNPYKEQSKLSSIMSNSAGIAFMK